MKKLNKKSEVLEEMFFQWKLLLNTKFLQLLIGDSISWD